MKPILFSGPMVRGILENRKGMTRRVIQPQPDHFYNCVMGEPRTVRPQRYDAVMPDKTEKLIKSRYQPGDILWVRETWKVDASDMDGDSYVYRADVEREKYPNNLLLWRPSIFMPRAVARLFLRVTDVRVERLQKITEADACLEGVTVRHDQWYRDGFRSLWDTLNAKRGYDWDKNPWVWVYSFERISKEEAERSVA